MTARRGGHDRDTRRCLAAVVLALGSLTATACNSAHRPENIVVAETDATVSYTHLTLPTIYSV